MANNAILFNAAYAGALGGMQQRWIQSAVSADYNAIRNRAVALATAVDAAIAKNPLITLADGATMQSICQGVFAKRFSQTDDATVIAASIAMLFNTVIGQNLPLLTSAYENDFIGTLAVGGVLSLPRWTAFGTPVISQRDVDPTHTTDQPGQLQLNLDAAAADTSCIFFGPWDWSKISAMTANVMIPTDGTGNELANCAFGCAIVTDPTSMDPASNGGVWNDDNMCFMVRSGGAGPGTWLLRRETAGSGSAVFTNVPVTLDQWVEIKLIATAPGSGSFHGFFNGTQFTTGTGFKTSGIAYFAIGGIRTAANAGRNIVVDKMRVDTFPLSRFT